MSYLYVESCYNNYYLEFDLCTYTFIVNVWLVSNGEGLRSRVSYPNFFCNHAHPIAPDWVKGSEPTLSYHWGDSSIYYWGERERAPPLMMSTALASVRPSVPPSVRPSSYVSQTTHARYSRDICGLVLEIGCC